LHNIFYWLAQNILFTAKQIISKFKNNLFIESNNIIISRQKISPNLRNGL
jgi:hypothetical protein